MFFLIYLALFAVGLVAMALAFNFTSPNSHYVNYFIKEDCLVENLTVFFFFAAFALAVFLLFKYKKEKIILGGISIFSLVCFSDEISFLEKFFLRTKYEILGIKIDAAHDFLEVGKAYFIEEQLSLNSMFMEFIPLLSFLIVVLIIVIFWDFFKKVFWGKIGPFFWSCFVLAIFASLIDMRFLYEKIHISNKALVALEEYSEMAISMALFFLCLQFFWNFRKEKIEAEKK